MYFIIPLFVLIFISLFEQSVTTFIIGFIGYFICLCSASYSQSSVKKGAQKVLSIVFPVYVVSAYIFSLSFAQGQFFLVFDPTHYIVSFTNINFWDWDRFWEILEACYINFGDNNGLYVGCMELMGYLSNEYFTGASVLSLTIIQTVFGVLTSISTYKILSNYFEVNKAVKYTIIFALFTYIHFYSCVIIRDIIITFFYTWGLQIVLKKEQNIFQLVLLTIIFLIIIGLRLYTGLFFGAFIAFWFYRYTKNSSLKYISYLVLAIGFLFIISSFASSILYEQTMEQMAGSEELSESRGGLSNVLRGLPPGLKQISLILLAMFGPLNPISSFESVSSFSNIYMLCVMTINSLVWFFIFYGLLYMLFVKKRWAGITTEEKMLFLISLLFISLNTSHIDIRRMMGVFPFLYLLYLQLRNNSKINIRRINRLIWALYLFVVVVLFFK